MKPLAARPKEGDGITIEINPTSLRRLLSAHHLSVEELRPITPKAKRQVMKLLLDGLN